MEKCSEALVAGVMRRQETYGVQVRYRNNTVRIGQGAPIVVQSMTNTDTADVEATVRQVMELADAGSELVRMTVNTPEAAQAVPLIREHLDASGYDVPLIGDFHYNGHLLLTQFTECAQALSKYRINPGNVGQGAKKDLHFADMIEVACRHDKPVRIGVNWGSLDQGMLERLMDENARRPKPWPVQSVMYEALIASAVESADRAVQWGLPADHIVLSCKVSGVQDLVAVYRELSRRCRYALHLGLTEAGMGSKGIVASVAALSVLLQEGIGDTIRISLTPGPGEPRTKEVVVAQELLQTMGLRNFFQKLAGNTQNFLREQMPVWRERFPGVETMRVAVMGCIVNGPGESRHADIGISLPGRGESPAAPVFEDGQKTVTLRGGDIDRQFQQMIVKYVESRFGKS